jgi:hypothetical protein
MFWLGTMDSDTFWSSVLKSSICAPTAPWVGMLLELSMTFSWRPAVERPEVYSSGPSLGVTLLNVTEVEVVAVAVVVVAPVVDEAVEPVLAVVAVVPVVFPEVGAFPILDDAYSAAPITRTATTTAARSQTSLRCDGPLFISAKPVHGYWREDIVLLFRTPE